MDLKFGDSLPLIFGEQGANFQPTGRPVSKTGTNPWRQLLNRRFRSCHHGFVLPFDTGLPVG